MSSLPVRIPLLIAGFLVSTSALAATSPIHHQLTVRLNPESHSIDVTDSITFPVGSAAELHFSLHAGLQPEIISDNNKTRLMKTSENGLTEQFRLELADNINSITLKYQGQIHHPLEAYGKEQARGFRDSPGLIDMQGVFLSNSTFWYPQFENFQTLSFNLDVELPAGWSSVSQGTRRHHELKPLKTLDSWNLDLPQQEIYLIAAPFHEFSRHSGDVIAQVFLRKSDQRLAEKYLDATIKYLKMYQKLLGPYAYRKFALVENFWETGFGMPSFTLLGSKVIRLPFIINSSYPHEILHNWWGNGVYVDYNSGNWSEGLTAYLADHLIKEQQGQGSQYRLHSLQKYRDYASRNRDFPLSQFRGRHSSASEAVGYGKTLMLFHMLRQLAGDDVFTQSLQQFYKDYRFKVASFADIQDVFEQQSGLSLSHFFDQWVNRTGAPDLQLIDTTVIKKDAGFQLKFLLQQIQPGEAYNLDIPVAITLKDDKNARQVIVSMRQKQQHFVVDLPSRPLRIDIDPEFDLFRKLAITETPAAFTQLFGARNMRVVLPSAASPPLKAAWRSFARDMQNMGPDNVTISWDNELRTLPEDRAVTVLGWSNRFASDMTQALADHDILFNEETLTIGTTGVARKNHSIALTTRYGKNLNISRAFIATDLAEALPGLGRKLPHYHKYSYLAFSGSQPENQLKGRWTVTDSPMSVLMAGNVEQGELAKVEALAEPTSEFDSKRMMQTIRYLSSDELQGRGFSGTGLDRAAEFIARAMYNAGLKPAGDSADSYLQNWKDRAGDPELNVLLNNVIGVIPGHHPTLKHQNVVIGAHYDHLGLGWPDVRSGNIGRIHHGADDNASGIAVLLELARVLGKTLKPDRTLVFVAFSAEEAGRKGSKFYTEHQTIYPVSQTIGMINLDTVGRLNDKRVRVLGAGSASEWTHIFRGIGFVTGIPTVLVREPLDASDQVSFHEAGVPAVQLFSGVNADYHRPTDTVDKIDAEGLVKIARISKQVVEYLAAREQPLSRQLPAKGGKVLAVVKRKVSLGTVPDFTFQGDGYRLDGVVAESPAARAGLKKHDIIIKINGSAVHGLRDISRLLKTLQAGQTITFSYRRMDKVLTGSATLESK